MFGVVNLNVDVVLCFVLVTRRASLGRAFSTLCSHTNLGLVRGGRKGGVGGYLSQCVLRRFKFADGGRETRDERRDGKSPDGSSIAE